eukprot:TRINITY_DN61073_c0_g1_i1.p1 TRINITY_DN61073_c0_g1~~TRINITY_DN61073_c0_g1_i1.p1  ORF type:complete len:666 (+),score=73.54 TRINITY_DN61073_c0_g1_i1:67-2064(+)
MAGIKQHACGVPLLSCFEAHDTGKTGTISHSDLLTVLKTVGSLSDSVAEAILLDFNCEKGTCIDYRKFVDWVLNFSQGADCRTLSLPAAVVAAGGIESWNIRCQAESKEYAELCELLDKLCTSTTVNEALAEVEKVVAMRNDLLVYAYMRRLHNRNANLFYGLLIANPALLLPFVYTPTVGEACQKFGTLPFYRRGCYLSINDRGHLKTVLENYAKSELVQSADGRYMCECIVFSDGGRILGLGDLGAWGMGIPIGKLDLYTVCAGVNPYLTIPVIIDAGISGPEGNTDNLPVRDHAFYTGLKQPRATHKSPEGTVVNSAYFGTDNLIAEFMDACEELFGPHCLLQFEDFNSNDALPLLAEYRDKHLTYNDDIQGTASVAVAGMLGAIKIRDPSATDLLSRLSTERFLFHGSGSANIGIMKLLRDEAKVPASSIFATNSRGLLWVSEDSAQGNFRNAEQKAFAQVGEPSYDAKNLVTLVEQLKPTCVIGAVGVAPNCFTKPFIETLVRVNSVRPVIFALSNPKSKAEVTAEDAYSWSDGTVIYGSGTWFASVEVCGKVHAPAQVNNVYIFPGVSYGVVRCQAKTIPERLFMVAAEAVANSIDAEDREVDRCLPDRKRIRDVGLNVATAVVMEAQNLGLATRKLGDGVEDVKAALQKMMWIPTLPT